MMCMKYTRVIFIIGLMALAGCKNYETLEVGQPTNLQVNSVSESSINLTVHLPIRNPNIYMLKLTRVEGTTFINNKKAGEIINREKIRIPANSDEIHELSFKVDYSDLLSGGMSLLNIMRTGEVKLRIKGTLTAKSFLYKKELEFDRQRTVNLNR